MYDNFEELSLDELLPPVQVARATSLLSSLCGTEITLLHQPEEQAAPVEFNLEPVAWLKADLPVPQLRAATSMLELLLLHAGKYRLAANLHDNSIEASYKELKQKHADLQASETRYRALSESLQEQVDAQVKLVRDSQQKLYESSRLRAVGQLAAGMAHEINTPIGFITSNLRTAQEYLGEIASSEPKTDLTEITEDFHSLLEESLEGAFRISNLIRDIRLFANIDQTNYHDFDLNELIQTTLRLLQPEISSQATISLCLDHIPHIPGYPAKIGQAIHNALTNALRALSLGEGRIIIGTRLAGDYIELSVKDNGHGMTEEVRARAFEPFFTTREVGMGSGLGLSIIRDVALAHRGRVILDSEEGQGTHLTLLLPTKGSPT